MSATDYNTEMHILNTTIYRSRNPACLSFTGTADLPPMLYRGEIRLASHLPGQPTYHRCYTEVEIRLASHLPGHPTYHRCYTEEKSRGRYFADSSPSKRRYYTEYRPNGSALYLIILLNHVNALYSF